MSKNTQAVARLTKEYKTLQKDFDKQISAHPDGMITQDNFIACPDPKNLFQWYFIMFGIQDEPYVNGYYLGRVNFPQEYPWKPPSIRLLTESGRIKPSESVCLSISEHHPESWNPALTARSIITSLLSFFMSDETVGQTIDASNAVRKKFAANSKAMVMKHPLFKAHFATMGVHIGLGAKPAAGEE